MPMKKSKTIGVVINHSLDYFFLNQVYTNEMYAISVVAKERNYNLLLEISDNQKDVFKLFYERKIDGMLLMGVKKSSGLIEQLVQKKIPFVLIGNYHGECQDICQIDIDDKSAIYNVTQYLIGLGHKNIGIITGSLEYASCSDRLDGYCEALKDAGIEINRQFIQICENITEAKAESLTKTMLYNKNPISALIAFNDNVALAAYKAARDDNLNIPQDFSVVGFDDTPIASYVTPALTSVWQPSSEKGQMAMNMLIDALEKEELPHGKEKLECITMYRHSCAKFNKK